MHTWLFVLGLGLVGLVACADQPADSVEGSGKQDSFGSFTVGDKEFARIAPEPVLPFNQFQLDAIIGTFLALPVIDFRNSIAAEASLDKVERDGTGQPIRLGRVAYVRPGLGNIAPSPAHVFMLAQHFDVVVVLFTNMTSSPEFTKFGRMNGMGIVNVPEALRGKIKLFGIGSEQWNLISAQQQSDVLLEQLQILHEHKDELGFDALQEPAWMFAHSQGALDAVISDHRLRQAGFAGFERIISVGGALEGGRLIPTATGLSWRAGAALAAGFQGDAAIAELDPGIVQDILAEHLELDDESQVRTALDKRIDFAFGGTINPFFPPLNVRPGLFALASTPDLFGFVGPNDGMVSIDSSHRGRRTKTYNQTDHVQVIEDPDLLADMVGILKLGFN